jgi:uncharacterized glyoxalase superfamily protein PhnB
MPATMLNARTCSPGLTVKDLDASVRFYTEGLGFAVEEEWKVEGARMGVSLVAGGATLNLSQDDFAKGRDRVKGVGMRLFIETDQDLDALAGQARATDIVVDGPAEMPWGVMGLTVTDPDGFKTTISKPA